MFFIKLFITSIYVDFNSEVITFWEFYRQG